MTCRLQQHVWPCDRTLNVTQGDKTTLSDDTIERNQLLNRVKNDSENHRTHLKDRRIGTIFILNEWFHLLLWPSTVSRRCHRAYILADLFTWALPQLEIQETHFFFLSLSVMLTSDTPWSSSITDEHRPCVTLSGVFVEGHSDNIQIFFYFFLVGGGDMSSFSGLALTETQQKSARLGVKGQTKAAARGVPVVHTWLQPPWPLCRVQIWRSAPFNVITPKWSIPLYCQIKPTCETNQL